MKITKPHTTLESFLTFAKCHHTFKLITFILLWNLILPSSFAQYYNQRLDFLNANKHWAIGLTFGLEFNLNGGVTNWSNQTDAKEGLSSVSDRNTGELLFYTDGGNVWNKNHRTMPDGSGLVGNSSGSVAILRYSSNQGSLIVPFLDDSNKYYLFSLTSQGGVYADPISGARGSLFYNVIDMTLDSNRGDVVNNFKNLVLDSLPLHEALIAIPGCDNDIWVVTRTSETRNAYLSYHITKEGLNSTPVISPSSATSRSFNVGSLAVSPNREMIAFRYMANNAFAATELSLFNTDGTVSSSVLIPPPGSYHTYGTVFSPDNSKLYISYYSASEGNSIYQYDISKLDSMSIVASKQLVFNGLSMAFRTYNDTIYFHEYLTPNIHRINKPNEAGITCDIDTNIVSLPTGTYSFNFLTLGNDVVFPLQSHVEIIDTFVCSLSEGVVLSPKHSYTDINYKWSNGDTSESIIIREEGIYWVIHGDCLSVDSFIVRGSDLFTTITVKGNELEASGGSFASYQWYLNEVKIPGATQSTFRVTENGDYTVEVTDEDGCVFISDVYVVNNATNIQNLNHQSQSVKIFPNPTFNSLIVDYESPVNVVLHTMDGREVLSVKNVNKVSLVSLPAGVYLLQIKDENGQVLMIEKLVKNQ